MMKLTKIVLSVFLAAAFAAGSFNVSATESLATKSELEAKTPSATERMKFRTIENLMRSHSSVTRSITR